MSLIGEVFSTVGQAGKRITQEVINIFPGPDVDWFGPENMTPQERAADKKADKGAAKILQPILNTVPDPSKNQNVQSGNDVVLAYATVGIGFLTIALLIKKIMKGVF